MYVASGENHLHSNLNTTNLHSLPRMKWMWTNLQKIVDMFTFTKEIPDKKLLFFFVLFLFLFYFRSTSLLNSNKEMKMISDDNQQQKYLNMLDF